MIRGIGLRGAVAVNVITMIGIGPLITIPLVLANLHGSTALVAWVAGAIIAICDGLAWAELGSMYPGSGGTYVFLREAFGRERYGRLLAFLFAWQIVLSAPLVLASGYIGFANYAGYLWPALANDARLAGFAGAAVGILTLLLLYRSITFVGKLGIALAGVAIATLGAVIVAAATRFSPGQALSADSHIGFVAAMGAGLGPALVITLYDYYGYGAACTIGDEVRAPARVLPRSVWISIVVVGLLYVALQLGVLGVIPWRELVPATANGATPALANYVASSVVERVWGSWPARIVTVAILATAFASTFGNLLAYSRVPYAAAGDGLFFKAFANLSERGRFPKVSLLVIGLLALPACFLSLGNVINALTAGLVIVQSIAQLGAVAALRFRGVRAPYRMWLFPLPAVIAFAGWVYIFCSAGTSAIVFGIVSLVAGIGAFAIRAARSKEWPFAAAPVALALAFGAACISSGGSPALAATSVPAWGHAVIDERGGDAVFEVDGKPFFVYGAAFFYERMPRDQWERSMQELRQMGINTLDLYVPWNWHELSDGDYDFDGHTSPRRDLDTVLRLARQYNFKILLRPGPVVRNEWRNGGYPAWLLSRPEYGMPLHDLLEGRYPPTATLQNQHSDDAAAQWMNNATHMAYAKRWIERVMRECAPDADLILAVALDDDQGAYIDNETFPAPHFNAYIGTLRDWVHAVTGPKELTYINTYQMKVTARAPAWAMGNWYQSDAYAVGEHDRSQLAFSTSLLQTQPDVPHMTSEFQAGWLQQPGDVKPRSADPSNTLLAMSTMIGMGVRGIVNFPAQDTRDPSGWEAPFANGLYAWDAALTLDLKHSPRYDPTASIGGLVRIFGPQLAAAVPEYDGAIAYLGESYNGLTSNQFYSQLAERTMEAERACRDAQLSCVLVDPEASDAAALAHYRFVLVSTPDIALAAPLRAATSATLINYTKGGGLVIRSASPNAAELLAALQKQGRPPIVSGVPGASFARDTTGTLAGFLTVTNYSDTDLDIRHSTIDDGSHPAIVLPPFRVAKHSAIVAPVDVHLAAFNRNFGRDDRLRFTDCMPDGFADATGTSGADPTGSFEYLATGANPCNLFTNISGKRNTIDASKSTGEIRAESTHGAHVEPAQPAVPLQPASPLVLAPALDTAVVSEDDIYKDGLPCTVFDNSLVKLVVAQSGGARAFEFDDDQSGQNIFTTVGALRDDVAVEPPLSATDRIARYTHQFPAGMFNRTYSATPLSSGTRASVQFAYDAPDVLPHGVTIVRTVSLEPHARAFSVDETASFRSIAANDPQRIVSVTSLDVGAFPGSYKAASVLAPTVFQYDEQSSIHVAQGNALGFYDGAHALATIAWRKGDVEDASIGERKDSIVVRLTLARGHIAHMRYGYEIAGTLADAQALVAAADAAAQVPTPEEGPTSPPRTP